MERALDSSGNGLKGLAGFVALLAACHKGQNDSDDTHSDDTGCPFISTDTYAYDTDGNILTKDSDFGADGTIDLHETCTYDANGNMLTKETYEYGPYLYGC